MRKETSRTSDFILRQQIGDAASVYQVKHCLQWGAAILTTNRRNGAPPLIFGVLDFIHYDRPVRASVGLFCSVRVSFPE